MTDDREDGDGMQRGDRDVDFAPEDLPREADEKRSRDAGPTTIGATSARILEIITARQEEWRSLPCYPARSAGDDEAAIQACADARADSTCTFRRQDGCPRRAAEVRADALEANLGFARVPQRHREVLLAALPCTSRGGLQEPRPLDDTDALRIVRAFVARRPARVQLRVGGAVELRGHEDLLFLGGNIGTGKSLAAAWALQHRGGGRFIPAYELGGIDDELQEKARSALFLVLDDLGTELATSSEWSISRLTSLLYARFDDRRPTIITTNMLRKDLEARYGERIGDRINQAGLFVALAGKSLRGRAAPPPTRSRA